LIERADDRSPSLTSLHNWSAKRNWASQAQAYDENVAEKALSILATASAEDYVERSKRLIGAEQAALTAILSRIHNVECKTVGQLNGMADLAIKCGKMAELLTGGATSRHEVHTGEEEAGYDDLLQALKDAREEREAGTIDVTPEA
jgi:hypothetical protein